jgi:dTDP-4-dehydrorhamnose reductase
MKVLIIGATGMLGYSLFSNLSDYSELEVYGTVRNLKGKEHFFRDYHNKIIEGVEVYNVDNVEAVIANIKPDVVINCIGLIKQQGISEQHIDAISINSLLPHQLASICTRYEAKLIHFSTDCIFAGTKGGYLESDIPDAVDLYGKSKSLGEVNYAPHLTLRTSIIGHELNSNLSLIDWFLSQKQETRGFSKAIFSGLPTCYIAKLLVEKILFNKNLSGLYQLSVNPIDKYSLLMLVSEIYCKSINIIKSKEFVIDRSLDSTPIREKIDFHPPSWRELIEYMHEDFVKKYKGV